MVLEDDFVSGKAMEARMCSLKGLYEGSFPSSYTLSVDYVYCYL
jgi:hypothetical protein